MAKRNHGSQLAVEVEQSAPVTLGKPEVRFLGAIRDTLVTEMILVNEIAKSKMIVRNVTYPNAKKAFPYEPQMQTIDRYFPLADGGPLYVDQIGEKDPATEKNCAIKQRVMREANLRYLVLKKDTDLVDAMNQLEGLSA